MTASSRTSIARHRFGGTDLIVSEYGLGCARIGGVFKNDPADFITLLRAALDAGVTFFDTADMYSQGESETLIGRAFRRRRHEVVITSKAGYVLPSQRRLIARIKPLVRPVIKALGISRQHLPSAVRGELAQNFSAAHLTRAIEGSLQRLHTDYLDLFQLHSPPADVVAPGEWLAALESLKQQGKIRYYGVSCDSVDAAAAALTHANVASLQLPINLLERDAVTVLPQAKRQGVGVIARECLANGLLAKDVASLDLGSYVRSAEEGANKAARIGEYSRVATAEGCTLPQLALRYVNGLDGVSVTLIGVSRLPQLESLLAAGLPSTARPDARVVPHLA